jgi:hypothetical protein
MKLLPKRYRKECPQAIGESSSCIKSELGSVRPAGRTAKKGRDIIDPAIVWVWRGNEFLTLFSPEAYQSQEARAQKEQGRGQGGSVS